MSIDLQEDFYEIFDWDSEKYKNARKSRINRYKRYSLWKDSEKEHSYPDLNHLHKHFDCIEQIAYEDSVTVRLVANELLEEFNLK